MASRTFSVASVGEPYGKRALALTSSPSMLGKKLVEMNLPPTRPMVKMSAAIAMAKVTYRLAVVFSRTRV